LIEGTGVDLGMTSTAQQGVWFKGSDERSGLSLHGRNGNGRERITLDERRPRRRPSGPGGLTRREVEVLELVSCGMTNRAVARALWVTSETVKFHLSNIYRKLGVTNRSEASDWAHDNGINGFGSRVADGVVSAGNR
jgi:DNA-binding NarL/FixJ family response regulator